MILVDTSVWADHIRHGDDALGALLHADEVLMHPFVLGEIALGSPKDRDAWLGAMQSLQDARVATDKEVLGLIDHETLYGSGVGYVDAHLIASARLSAARLWTRDRGLAAIARRLGVAAPTA